MRKEILATLISVFVIHCVHAQKSFDVTIKLDPQMNARKVHCYYFDGIGTVFITDTFVNNVLELKGVFYSQLMSVNINYYPTDTSGAMQAFFVSGKPAKIDLFFMPGAENGLFCHTIENASPMYDTIANPTFKALRKFKLKETGDVGTFLKKNGRDIMANDTVKKHFFALLKAENARSMVFLREHSGEYFSFWYFMDQIADQALGWADKDTTYLRGLMTYYLATFPDKYTASVEGKAFIRRFDALTYPTPIGKAAPVFDARDVFGNRIALDSLSGKYVLLDFWATWCRPCMMEMPVIKEIRKNYPSEKLVIVGISLDLDTSRLSKVIASEGLNWIQIFDKGREISGTYGVSAIPATFLIDKEGRMAYRFDSGEEAKMMLPRFLQ